MNNITVAVQLLSVVAMFAGAYGSMLFVDKPNKPADYEAGSRVFLLGNVTNISLGLYTGDLSLVIAQAALAYFTLPMFKSREFKLGLVLILLAECSVLPLANHLGFKTSYLGMFASAVAVAGAWAMSKAKWDTMNWSWVIADLAFIHIAIVNRLLGLGIVATLFVWHGFLRIMRWKRTGLLTFTTK